MDARDDDIDLLSPAAREYAFASDKILVPARTRVKNTPERPLSWHSSRKRAFAFTAV
jgi:hypothetical protein